MVNLGLASFADELRRCGAQAVQVEWRPTGGGDPAVVAALDACLGPGGEELAGIAAANQEAVGRVLQARPTIVGIGTAGDVIPGMRNDLVLHAGPPVEWERMCGPMRGAVIGGLLYEGLAATPEEADRPWPPPARSRSRPATTTRRSGPMAGIVTASMPVWILENGAFGNRAYATLNEGLGKVLRYGAYGDEVIERLRWMERRARAGRCARRSRRTGPLDLRSLIAQALQMGDEGHNRNRAGHLAAHPRAGAGPRAHEPRRRRRRGASSRFLDGNDHFFLNLSMAACKCVARRRGAGSPRSTMVTVMARNGTDFGIQLSAIRATLVHRPRRRWSTASTSPASRAADAAPDIGDSVITETAGLGGFAMAAAPAIVQFVGGSAAAGPRLHPADVRDHPGRAPGVQDPRPGLPRHRRPASTP